MAVAALSDPALVARCLEGTATRGASSCGATPDVFAIATLLLEEHAVQRRPLDSDCV
jgi:hypothetical protein